jgi:outer membrane lipoprotein-sorting protein
MMKKIYLFIVALVLIAGSTKAQNDSNAKKILDAVSAKLKTYKGITAGFNLVSKGRSGKVNNRMAGKIYIKGNKFYIKHGASEIFSDGNKTWNYNGNDEVTVADADANTQTLSPQSLFTNFYDKDFTYKLVSSVGNYNEIQLIPNDKRKNFQRVNVFVDKARMMITKARVLDKSNSTIEVNLSNINTAANIPDNTFVFNKNKYKKNIEVIE